MPDAVLVRRRQAGYAATAGFLIVASASVSIALGPKAVLIPPIIALAVWAILRVLLEPDWSLTIFLVLLPIYLMTLVVLYGVVGLPSDIIRILQPWKEIVLVLALLGAIARHVRLGEDLAVSPIDLLVGAFVLVNLAYVVFPSSETELSVRLAGLRANLLFVPVFLLGRLAITDRSREQRSVRLIAGISVMAVLGVVVEKLLLPTDWPLRLGYSRFLIDFFGAVDVQSPDELPWTFWTEAKIFRRPSSFFANPLDLAAGCLLFLGAMFAMYLLARRRHERAWLWLGISLSLVATVCISLARMAIATLPVVLVSAALVLGRRRLALAVIVISFGLGALALVIAGPLVRDYIQSTVSFQNASSVGHLDAWRAAVTAMLDHPFGLGLGTSGAVGARAGNGTGGENQYLILGVQLGFAGIALYIGLLTLALGHLVRALRTKESAIFGAGLAGMLSLLSIGLSSEIGSYIFLLYITWWIAGYAVTTNSRSTASDRLQAAHQ